MSKVVKAVVGIAVAAVGVITGNPLLIAQGAMMTLGAILQKDNAGNKATTGRLSKNLEPEDFRKIIFGKTMGASDLRYWETWGSDYTKFDEVIAVATHRIHSFQETYIEEELVGLGGGSASGTYAGALSVSQTTTGGHLAAGGGSLWGANAKMTGVPHYVFKWVYDEKKLPQGIPSRYTRVVEGAYVYDPRRDSTRGGSGSHRADDQSTWSYATLDSNGQPIGRNNALQMLWYLIGWRINGKLVAGRGVDLADIDFEGFIAAANDAEAEEYYTDMILSTGDAHTTNEGIISADGLIGELLDLGGLWTYRITRNDVAEVVVALDDDDVVEGGAVQWVPFKPMSDKYNEVAGSFIDPSPTSLYQPRAYPTVIDAVYQAMDGYKKRKTQNFQCVQNAALAQKLARLMLNRDRYQGEFSATFNLRALRARVWDIVWLSLERYGFEDKPFRVIKQGISANGVEMVLREEDASIYSGGTVAEQVPPSQGSKYDPRMRVLVTGMNLATGYIEGEDGTTQDALIVTWNPAPSNVRRTEVQYKLHADPDETKWQNASMTTSDAASCAIAPVVPGTEYDVRVRHWSVNEVDGPWTEMTVIAGDSTRSVANRVTYLDDNDLESWKPFEPYADVTANALAYASFYLASRDDRIATETRKRFDPLFWTCNFPSTMMASVVQPAPTTLRMDAVFFERGQLAGLIWESVDTLNHPTTAYDTKKDYRNTVLDFDYELTGDVKAVDEVEGMVMTIEGRDSGGSLATYYLQLYFCRTSGSGTSGHISIDFSDLPDEVGGGSIYAGDVDRMFISLVPGNYSEGSTTKLATPVTASMTLSNISVTGSNSNITCGLGPGGTHEIRMTNGYDDTYNVVPGRIIRNCQLLGYKNQFNHYVGMSHYFQWLWNAGESRYIAQDAASPLNVPCVKWHEALAAALADAGMTFIISLSYEMLNSFAPTSWRQLDSSGNPALTGWEPPSALLSPCNTTAMGYLSKVARQFCNIADAAGLDVHFQVGEPWYWVNFAGTRTPFFYDPATTAAYTSETGLTAPVITDMTAPMTSPQLDYLDWLGEKLAESILDHHDAVRGDHPLMRSYALLYLPQLLDETTPENHRVNMPPALAYPALDVLQLEDYDFVIANDREKSAQARGRAEETLGYPRSKQEYFSGFALFQDTSGNIWRYSSTALQDAYQWGVSPVYIWAYTQVMRDGYVPLMRMAPPLEMGDLRDVDLVTPATEGQVLRWDDTTKKWVPANVDSLPGFVNTFLNLTDTPSTYMGHAFEVPRVNAAGTGLEFASVSALPSGGAAGTILQKYGAGDGEATWSNLTAGITAFTPTGSIAATDVQSAIAELDAEKQTVNARLTALSGVASGADSLPYFTGATTMDVTAFTAYGRTLVGMADATALRMSLGLATSSGYDVGTVGTKIPLLDTANFWSALQDFQSARITHANAYTADDGKIAAGVFGEGLNIVGVQTVAVATSGTFNVKMRTGGSGTFDVPMGVPGNGRVVNLFGRLVQGANGSLANSLGATVFTGAVSVPDEAYSAAGWNGDLTVPTKNAVRDKIESLALGATTFLGLSDTPATYTGSGLFFPQVKADGTGLQFVAVSQLPAGGATGTILQKYAAGDGAATWSNLTAGITAFTPTGTLVSTNVQAAIAELESNKQVANARLTALSGVASGANALPYFTGATTMGVTTLSAFGRTLIDDADAAAARATLGITTPTALIPTLNSPWINYGGGFMGARYYKTNEGLVVLEGLIQAPGGSPTAGVVLFTLLAGYRPSSTQMFCTWSGGGACRFDVLTNGDVVMQNGNTAFTSLNGISFIAD